MVKVYLYTDGGARGNPGPAAIGLILLGPDKKVIEAKGECLGLSTNNQAEYNALIKGLKLALRCTNGEVLVTLDSELVVKQLRGEYRVRNESLMPLYNQVMKLADNFKKVSFRHAPRTNKYIKMADYLVNKSLDEALKRKLIK